MLVSTGDGNTLSAIWKGWCDLKAVGLIDHLPKIDCVQSQASAAISETVHQIQDDNGPEVDWATVVVREVSATTIADSIAVDRPRDGLAAVKAVIQSGGEAVTVSDQEILAAIPEMARVTGVFPEPAGACTITDRPGSRASSRAGASAIRLSSAQLLTPHPPASQAGKRPSGQL